MSNTVFITGTSRGLGRAAARLFQARGWNVVATMRRPEHENELDRLDNTLVTRLDVQDNASSMPRWRPASSASAASMR